MAEREHPHYENLTKKEKEIEESAYEYYCNYTISDEDTDYEEDLYDSPKYLAQLDKILDLQPCE
jgi:hypothetical protein